MIVLLVALVLLLVTAVALGVVLGRRLRRLSRQAAGSWAEVGTVLERRRALAGDLLALLRPYADERRLVDRIDRDLTAAGRAHGVAEAARTERRLAATLAVAIGRVITRPGVASSAELARIADEHALLVERLTVTRLLYNRDARALAEIVDTLGGATVAALSGVRAVEEFQPD